jgi:hypothetical protein
VDAICSPNEIQVATDPRGNSLPCACEFEKVELPDAYLTN